VEKSNQTQNVVPQSIALRWWSVEKSSQTLLNGVVGAAEHRTVGWRWLSLCGVVRKKEAPPGAKAAN
jgi:hypothetical protein